MKPDFALNLSFDGITLLKRVAGGWAELGTAGFDGDLGAAMAGLREQADATDKNGVAVKLIVPNDQIKYLSIQSDGNVADAQVEAALDGATPYTVDQLDFDWVEKSGQVQIAAVARDTLEEAEAFAVEHGFAPASFVAVPPNGSFNREVFFGQPESWRGAVQTPEKQAIKIVPMPEPVPEPEPLPEPEPEIAPEPEVVAAPPTEPKAEEPAAQTAPEPADPVAEVSAPETLDAVDDAIEEPAANASEEDLAPQVFSSIRTPAQPAPLRVTDGQIPDAAAPKLGAATQSTDTPGAAPKIETKLSAPARITPIPAAISAGTAPPVVPASIDRLDAPTEKKLETTPDAAGESLSKPRPAPIEPADETPPSKGFFTRRSKSTPPPEVSAPASVAVADTATDIPAAKPSRKDKKQKARIDADERQKMTIFGAREEEVKVGGKPRFLGLMLTTLLLLFLAGVAAWASVFLDDGLARFFRHDDTQVAALPDVPLTEDAIELQQDAQPAEEEVIELAALTQPDETLTDLSQENEELSSALSQPIEMVPLTEEEAEATYAATGIWLRGPAMPALISTRSADDVYAPSIDPNVGQFDAVALPASVAQEPLSFDTPMSPLPAGTVFALDQRGLVIATLEGSLNPDGVRIFSGKPPAVPPIRGANGQILVPSTPNTGDTAAEGTQEAALEPLTETLRRLQGLSPVRPNARPTDLIEQNERANNAGRTLSELAKLRPMARPNSPQQDAEDDITATAQAVVASLHPMPRPRDIASIVSKSQRTEPEPQQVASVAPKTVKPVAPSSGSVAKDATVKNALNLRKINLIGVYGQPSDRRALVRLSNGEYKKVKVGDRIDGGRVSAIGENQLRYTKGGRNITLQMPKG